ncbi:MAG TPA: hypothetical protein VI565_10400, partial [Burkholderiales bacterium]|nr:hypothetical protein [Burkholderiales bacterium]
VSIVGPGGVGKTHLAHQVGRELLSRFRDGVYFVPLEDVIPQLPSQSTSLVEHRIAEALNVATTTGAVRETLLDALAQRELLLILDNFEQLTEAAELVNAITLRAPGTRLLITSRHRLGLPTEWMVALDGLAYPQNPAWDNTSLDFPAVELFTKVAERLEFRFDADVYGVDVLRICKLVAGYPLAILLAARWLMTLSCRDVADRLAVDADLINDAPHSGQPERHRTMACVLDCSWALLTEPERAAFSALSGFSGGFSPQAAIQVTGCDFTVLDGLVNKSLLHRVDENRFEIHALLQALGQRKLRAQPARAQEIRDAHADYYGALLAREHARIGEDSNDAPFAATRRELGNLLAAFDYLVACQAPDRLAPLLAGLWTFHRRLGWFEDGAVLLRRALKIPGMSAELIARWQLWLSDAYFQLGRHGECRDAVLASLALSAEPTPETGSSRWYVLRELSKVMLRMRRAPRSAPIARDIARAHNRLAQVYFFEGDRDRFLASTLRSVNVGVAINAAPFLASGALVLSYTPFANAAARHARRALRVLNQADPFDRAWTHEQLALYYLGCGNLVATDTCAKEGAALFRSLGQHKNYGECLGLHAYAAAHMGDLRASRTRWEQAWQLGCERNELFSQVWAACGFLTLDLRSGARVPPSRFATASALAGKLVDPNTHIIYYGILAWLSARQCKTADAIDALRKCRWLFANSSMLSIYALDGFVGQAMALRELGAGEQIAPAALAQIGTGVLGDFDKFASVFP